MKLITIKRAINIFYASNGRLPGDKDNSGVLVYNSADECTWGNSNYGADLQKSQDMYEELYDNGALDTKLSFEDCIGTEECIGKVTLGSKAFKDGAYSFSCIKSYDDRWSFFENFAGGNVLIFDSNYYTFDSNIAKKIDTILDDGVFNTGQVISYTFNCEEDYDECDEGVAEMFFKLDI